MVRIAMKQLLEAGAHFGHQTRRWNPKMASYIYTKRKNIHIIDLQQTLRIFREVLAKVTEIASGGVKILFVGTKKQASEAIEREARRCGMFYVNTRWVGGMLTNYTTISKSIDKLRRMEDMVTIGKVDHMGNKEAKRFRKELARLTLMLSGIREMKGLPDLIVVIDMKREITSVMEAQKLKIPVLGILDTNCDPDWATYGIPGNDDAIRAIALYLKTIADAIMEGQAIHQQKLQEAEKAAADAAAAAGVAAAAAAGAAAAASAAAAAATAAAAAAAAAVPAGVSLATAAPIDDEPSPFSPLPPEVTPAASTPPGGQS